MARVAGVILAIAAAVTSVSAQDPLGTTNVTCSGVDYTWANNELGQSPCLVAAKLVASTTCYDQEYNVDPLEKDAWYINGDDPPDCMCNDVAYSLFSACGDCQGHVWLDWAAWSANCTSTSHAYQGDIPADTDIPTWAQIDVEKKGNYSPSQAKAFALAAISSSSAAVSSSSASLASASSLSASASSLSASLSAASLSATSTFPSATPNTNAPPGEATTSSYSTTATPSATTGADSTWSSSGGSKSSNVGPIAGGVAAGVVLIGGVILIGLWLRRKQVRARTTRPATSYAPSFASTASQSLAPGMMGENPARASQLVAQRYYDPGVQGAAASDSYYGASSAHPQRQSRQSYGTRNGGYGGAPEV